MYIALGMTYSFVPQACGGLESDFTLFPNTLLRARSTLVLLTKAKCKPHVYIYVVQVNALGQTQDPNKLRDPLPFAKCADS